MKKRNVVTFIVGTFIGLCITTHSIAQQTLPSKETGPVIVTPESIQWIEGPKGLPEGAQMVVLKGDPKTTGPFTLRLKFPPKYQIHAIRVSGVEQITVISGTLQLGLGDQLDPSQATLLLAGGFVALPANTKHFALSDEGAIIQINGVGPWRITYVNPKYDPREKVAQ